ncbi:MAG: hypothetical protein M3Q42_06300 [Pseudomonadota bacterium]|nr:hypothetical protein [Pseudomonadota bacterium]
MRIPTADRRHKAAASGRLAVAEDGRAGQAMIDAPQWVSAVRMCCPPVSIATRFGWQAAGATA